MMINTYYCVTDRMEWDVNDGISCRNSKGKNFSVCISISILYGDILSLITVHTQIK